MKLIIVGECPSRPIEADRALTGRIGDRLSELLGWSVERYERDAHRLNLCETPQWSDSAARKAADRIWSEVFECTERTVLVLLGNKVKTAIGFPDLDPLRSKQYSQLTVLALPHPSGRNRFWNDASDTRKAKRALRWAVFWAGAATNSEYITL